MIATAKLAARVAHRAASFPRGGSKRRGQPSHSLRQMPRFPERLLTEWDDVQRLCTESPPPASGTFELWSNRFADCGRGHYDRPHADATERVRRATASRLASKAFRRPSRATVSHTIRYLYFHMRCGVYVRIRDGKLQRFAPFANPRYENRWSDALTATVPGSTRATGYSAYFEAKERVCGRERLLPPRSWWCNSNIVCNVMPRGVWGDHMLREYVDLLLTLCKARKVPVCGFFLNKRDLPQVKRDMSDPYDGMRPPGAPPAPLPREQHAGFCAVMSGYTSPLHADIPFPVAADWRFEAPEGPPFAERRPVAVWRGSATGAGTTPATNPRLRAAQLSIENPGVLDAAMTSWNLRDKVRGGVMTFLDPCASAFRLGDFLSYDKQQQYKYQVYIEGHSAANRYGAMMASGSVILRAATFGTLAPDMWFFPALEPWRDHVPVAADLSDLVDKIRWCIAHEKECEAIAGRAASLHMQLLSVDGILDYAHLALQCANVAWNESDVVA